MQHKRLRSTRSLIIHALMLVWYATAAAGKESRIEFSKLKEARLPYGERIEISGTEKDVSDYLTVRRITVRFSESDADKAERASEGVVDEKNARWKVVVGPFREGAQVTLRFTFQGTPTATAAREIFEKFFLEGRFFEASARLLSSGVGKDSAAYRLLQQAFAQEQVEALKKSLPAGLELAEKTSETVRNLFFEDEVVNLGNAFKDALAGR